MEEGAEILIGGEGHPEGLTKGYFVRPTVFVNVKNSMTIAQVYAGRVYVNGFYEPTDAPFGGFKQSGLGCEVGVEGLAEYLQPQVLMGHRS